MPDLFLAAATPISAVGPLSATAQSTAPIAAGTGDYTIKVAVSQLSGNIRFGIEDSPDGTVWTPLATFDIAGSISTASGNEDRLHERSYDAPGLTVAGTSPQARVNVYKISGGAAVLTSLISY